MEYCPCGSLADYIRNENQLNESELREIASCCLLGLDYLHKRNIIHKVSTVDCVLSNRTSNRGTSFFPRRVS